MLAAIINKKMSGNSEDFCLGQTKTIFCHCTKYRGITKIRIISSLTPREKDVDLEDDVTDV